MDPRVTELHCIMPIGNVPSVVKHGILSHAAAAGLPHPPHSVAMQPVQDRRDRIGVREGRKLHHYANLYFHARNPMLFKRLSEASTLCVLRVSTEVLALSGTLITDCNAASKSARFLLPSEWRLLDFSDIFDADWTHQGDDPRYQQHKRRKCAEVLVPDRVAPRFLIGAYVADSVASAALERSGFLLPVDINPVLFFR